MLYLDANVFIYPVLYRGVKAARAKHILESVVRGGESAATASLTIDEVVWAFLNRLGRREAIRQGQRILAFPNLRVLDVRAQDVHGALGLMDRYAQLQPRDAVHAAVAINAGIFTIISDDADFEGVREVNHRGLS